ncbi:MSCRAMM family protein [Phaeacidiphilus oryzae]|uniref:MSCRAMM family protein n=1 Tax=Phaeacidiphilus oryzae TaxID=348818 RepID=UPI00068AC446|nr:carboxypeptidase-like regulatory domain-containing protein [Phaeacidiphilus oryzae]
MTPPSSAEGPEPVPDGPVLPMQSVPPGPPPDPGRAYVPIGRSAAPGTAPGAEAPTAPPAATAPSAPAIGPVVRGTVRVPDRSGVPRAVLTLIDMSGRQAARAATDSDGQWVFAAPGPGSYVLIAAAQGHQPQAVTLAVGARPVELDVLLGGTGRLRGRVCSSDGTPVSDAAVILTDPRGEVAATTRTRPDGGYEFTELVPGDYTLAVSARAFRPAALAVGVAPSGGSRQDVVLTGSGTLRGTVRTAGGRPVPEARVTLLDTSGEVVAAVVTGEDGRFRFTDLEPGDYTVIASGYSPVATALRIEDGPNERDLRLAHDPEA